MTFATTNMTTDLGENHAQILKPLGEMLEEDGNMVSQHEATVAYYLQWIKIPLQQGERENCILIQSSNQDTHCDTNQQDVFSETLLVRSAHLENSYQKILSCI